jgi:hypothetical protein
MEAIMSKPKPSNAPPSKAIATGCTNTHVASYGPAADFYSDKVRDLAAQCASALAMGDIIGANELYQRGVFAQNNLKWNRGLARCVGPDFTLMKTADA